MVFSVYYVDSLQTFVTSTYFVFIVSQRWSEAVSFCSEIGLYAVSFETQNEFLAFRNEASQQGL